MTRDPRHALDYPAIADDLYVIWSRNEHIWPSAKRRVSYVARDARHIFKNLPLFTLHAEDAVSFASAQEARAWIEDAVKNHPHPEVYLTMNITTVAELKLSCGFATT